VNGGAIKTAEVISGSRMGKAVRNGDGPNVIGNILTDGVTHKPNEPTSEIKIITAKIKQAKPQSTETLTNDSTRESAKIIILSNSN